MLRSRKTRHKAQTTVGAVYDHCCPNYNLVLGSNACVAWVSVWPSCKGCVPLPSGEGGAERRVRVRECVKSWPSSGPPGHLLPKGEGHALRLFANLDNSGRRPPLQLESHA